MNNRREINILADEIIAGAYEVGSYKTKNKNAEKIYELSLPVEFNENQQIVLECLKEEGYAKHYIEDVLRDLNNDSRILPNGVYKAYVSLSDKQFLEVLQAFAEWGLSHERN